MKKNGRIVAIALGSVLCASCVGGAFLVAGSTPAAETVRAADAETLTYKYSVPNNNYQNDLNQFLTDTVVLNGKTWKNSNPVTTALISGTKTKRYFQLGKSKDPFLGTTLSVSTSDLFGENFCVQEIELDFAMSGSALGGPVVTFAVDGTQIGEIESVGGMSNNQGHVVTTTASKELSGLLEITFAGRDSGALMLHSISITGKKGDVYDHISIAGSPTKIDYYVGDSFLVDGLTVNGYLDATDLNPIDLTSDVEWSFDPQQFSEVNSETSVIVTATYKDLRAETTINVNVEAPADLNELVVDSQPNKISYKYGESIDYSGLRILAKYSDGKTVDVTPEVDLSEHEISFDDCALGSYSSTIEYKGKEVILSFSASVEYSVSEYRSLDDDSVGSISGVVTGWVSASDNSLFITDGDSSILVYNLGSNFLTDTQDIIGKTVFVNGAKDTYSGLIEIKNVSDFLVGEPSSLPDPFEISEFNEDALAGMDSRLVHMSGLEYVSGNLASGGKASNVYLEYGNTDVTLRVNNNTHAVEIAGEISDFFNTIENLPFDFTGHLGWYNGPQLSPTSIDEFSCPDYDAVMAFINAYMKPNISQSDEGDGKSCLEWYPAAKAALEALTETQRNFFLTSDTTAAYANRYNNWAKAYGEGATSSLGTIMSSNDTAAIIALVALSSATVAAAGFMIASRRRKAK